MWTQERSYAQIEGFREMVDVCGLSDLGFIGRSWTFEKKVAGGGYCRVRLDHALATPAWRARFPDATLTNMSAAASDHGPILLRWRPVARPTRRLKGRFRYELMWEEHAEFSPLVAQKWEEEGEAHTLDDLKKKLSSFSN
jgi:hypothetical protein